MSRELLQALKDARQALCLGQSRSAASIIDAALALPEPQGVLQRYDPSRVVGEMVERANGEYVKYADAVALLASAQVASEDKPKFELTQGMRDALAKAAESGAPVAEMPDGSIMFINRGEDMPDYSDLNCPACGGSGHVDDASEDKPVPVADSKDAARYRWLLKNGFHYADNPNVSDYHKGGIHISGLYLESYDHEGLNAAIDAAIEKERAGGGT